MEKNLNSFISTLKPQEVTLVAGVPGSGKTSLELSVAVQCAMREKKKVVIFSIEMLSKHIIQWLLCQYAEVNFKKMVNGEFSKDDWEKITAASAALLQNNIFIDDSSRITPADIFLKCQDLEKTLGKIDLIIIDYFQLIFYDVKKYTSRKEENLALFKELKQVAAELNVPILLASQINPRLGVRESCERWLPEEIQPLWILYGNNPVGENPPDYDSSKARLEAVRGKNVGKVIPLTFDSKILQFWET